MKLPLAWLDDGVVSALPGGTFKLYINAYLWSFRHDTNGIVPLNIWATLLPGEGVRTRQTERLEKDELITGLTDDNGVLIAYVVVHYMEHEPSTDDRKKSRKSQAERTARSRANRHLRVASP